MNLTFGICWIEDQASEAEIEHVKAAVRNAGFEPNITQVQTEEEIRSFAQQQKHFQDYDLILLDLRLGGGIRGDELAPQVREAFHSTPILFYSAENEIKLRKMMAEKLVEGAYCTNRDRLSERINELVSNLTPALNSLDGMRGLAARVVAECDQELRIILARAAHHADAENETLNSLKDRVVGVNTSIIERVTPIASLRELLNIHSVSSNALFHEARKLIRKHHGSDDVRAMLRATKDYPTKVVERRNILAHALEERDEDGWRITGKDADKPLTVDDFKAFRSDFLEHLDGMRSLRRLLIGE